MQKQLKLHLVFRFVLAVSCAVPGLGTSPSTISAPRAGYRRLLYSVGSRTTLQSMRAGVSFGATSAAERLRADGQVVTVARGLSLPEGIVALTNGP